MLSRLVSKLKDLPVVQEVQEVQEVPEDPEVLIIKINNRVIWLLN
jgi:hypothetical protein